MNLILINSNLKIIVKIFYLKMYLNFQFKNNELVKYAFFREFSINFDVNKFFNQSFAKLVASSELFNLQKYINNTF